MRRRIFSLFWTFFKIGAFTFGGGYAMIPLISKEVSENKKWISEEDILDVVAIAESTPGPLAINSATFVGYKVAGVWGSVAATFGVVLPSFVIISIISFLLAEFQSFRPVQYALFGIRAGVLALVLKAFLNMFKKCPKNTLAYVLMGAAFLFSLCTSFSVIYAIIGCALIGLATYELARKEAKKQS